MKIIEGLKLKGKPAEVPGASRNDLPAFFVEMGYKVGAEVGVYRGEFTQKLCEPGMEIHAIDPWMGYVGAGRSEQTQDMQDYNFECAKKALSPYKNCKLIRKTSMEALRDYKNDSLDFVYIDGDHRFPYIAQDIYEWYWKIKKGGVISGHDYFCTSPNANNVLCQVKVVVDAFVEAYKIENFYTFGKNDRTLSWMFLKP